MLLRGVARRLPLAAVGVVGGAAASQTRCEGGSQFGWWSTGNYAPGLGARAKARDTRGAEPMDVEGPLVPLSYRYVGTKIERSPRAKLLMSDPEVEACARLINDLLDLAFFDEEDEQEIFEFCVCHVAEVLSLRLPNRVLAMIHNSKRMPQSDADAIERNICEWVFDYVELPFLDCLDRRCVVRCVVKLMTRSMTLERCPVGADMSAEEHTRIVTDIFLKSVDHRFTDESERQRLATSFAAYAEKVPLVPGNVVASVCDRLVESLAEDVHGAISSAYSQCNDAIVRGEDLVALAREESAKAFHATSEETITQRPFEAIFCCHLCREIMESDEFPLNYCPRSFKASASVVFMKEILTMIETDKLEAVFDGLREGVAKSKDAAK